MSCSSEKNQHAPSGSRRQFSQPKKGRRRTRAPTTGARHPPIPRISLSVRGRFPVRAGGQAALRARDPHRFLRSP